jgi:hypothetical protein
MDRDMKTYLEWRCRMNWHPKYLKYIQEWISNVTSAQLEYFKRERERLISKGIYNI